MRMHDEAKYLERALLAADWFVASQRGTTCDYKESWNSERGRFLYYYYMPGRQYVPGINWTQGRGLFTTCEAYKLTGKQPYLDAAYRAYRYVSALQITDPYYAGLHGVIKEASPQGSWCGVLDGAQAASGLLMYEAVTGDADALRRARAFGDFLLRHFDEERGLPSHGDLYADQEVGYGVGYGIHAIGQCSAIPLWHLYRRTGEQRYLRPLIWGANFCLECQRADGAMHNVKDIRKVEPSSPNHHEGRGEGDQRYVLYNDDGLAVVLLAAFQATGEARYLDAMVAYADWIVAQPVEERPYCAFPVRANTVLDVGRLAGRDYSAWVLDHLDKHLLDLQVLDSDDPMANGGFRGEDEQGDGGLFGGVSLDYVVTRVTCYAAGTLFRLSGRGTGAGFSVFGLSDPPAED